jgi:hypothetical protein
MELGGWNSDRMVLRYTHINVSHRAQTIAALPWAASAHTSRQITTSQS